MAQKLYYEQSTLKEWTTSIVDIQEIDGLYHIKLEDSAFYPESGGQPSDSGTIDGIELIECIDHDTEVIHVLREKPKTDTVKCVIDWDRRLDHMQHHSGQHLLSAAIIELYDIPTISFHLGKDTVTIDLDTPSLTSNQLIQIELAVYQKIIENNEIKTYFVKKDQLHTLNLRKLPKVNDEDIRIVEITDIDVSACCGTHVKQTGEIGLLKLLKTEKVRQSTRLHFKCGNRALEEFQKTNQIVSSINQLFNTNSEQIKDKIEQTISELKEAQKEIDRLKALIFDSISNECLVNAKNGIIFQSFTEEDMKDLQLLTKIIQNKQPSIIIFTSLKDNRLLFLNQTGSDLHCGNVIKNILSQIDGKGGGNSQQAQATFDSSSKLKEATNLLLHNLEYEIEE
ncbi:alanyl-tRNA editing protein [Gottfriedia solisilvae]|uniref:Alanyl-tRNA editing protein n=1 Tax=Gottfriedia solisilvae TaxID=1516104 RepID=A0A8J3F1K8_9BACI|nr:DHHA1 domain-containing protein [Gottfriedia solisilvae]GGI13461.1 alanyl-tRNA editing protein [Gottfriedia solisilvae]